MAHQHYLVHYLEEGVTTADVSTGSGDANQIDVTGHVFATADDLLLVGVVLEVTDAGKEVDTVVWDPTGDNQSLTKFTDFNPTHGKLRIEVWRGLDSEITAKTATVRVTIAGGNSQKVGVVAVSLTGVDQTTPLSGAATDEATDADGSVTVTQDEQDLAFCFAGHNDSTTAFTPGGGEGERADFADIGFRIWAAFEDGEGSTTLSWTQPASKENSTVGFVIEVASGVTTTEQTATPSVTVTVAFSRKVDAFRTFTPSATGSASLSTIAEFLRTLASTVTGSITTTATKLALLTLAATATLTASLATVSTFLRTLAASVTGSASRSQIFTALRTFAATATGSAIFSRVLEAARTFAATVAISVSLAKLALITKAASALVSVTTTTANFFERTISATVTAAVSLTKVFSALRTLSATATGTVSFSRFADLFRTFTYTATPSATLSTVAEFLRTFAATVTVSVSLTSAKFFQRTISTTVTVTVSLAKLVGKAISASVSASVSRATSIFKTLATTVTVAITTTTSKISGAVAQLKGMLVNIGKLMNP